MHDYSADCRGSNIIDSIVRRLKYDAGYMRRYGVTFSAYSLYELVGDRIMLSDLIELMERLNSEIPFTRAEIEDGFIIIEAIEQPEIERMIR